MDTPASSNGATALQQRLQDPEAAEALSRLLDRLDTIERAIDLLERLEATWPAALNTATDVVDDELTRAARRGVVLDERAGAALQLAETLTEPETTAVLTRLIDRLDQLEAIAQMADRLPGASAAAVDTLDEALTRAAERGVVFDERVRVGLRLLERMTEPRTAQALGAVLDRADRLERLAAQSDAVPDVIATVVDILDHEYARTLERGYDPERTLRQAAGALGRLGELFQSSEFEALLPSGILGSEALRAVGSLGSALVDSQNEARRGETPRRGLFGLMGALRDPDVQYAMGFLTRVAQKFGRNLQQQ